MNIFCIIAPIFLLALPYCATVPHAVQPASPSPRHEKVLVIDLAHFTWTAYDAQQQPIKNGSAIGGRRWCPDIPGPCKTPSGEFRVQRKGGAACTSNTYPRPNGGAPMPYCTFFKGGYAVHGWRGQKFTQHLSHGCVRVSIDDAHWLHQEFLDTPANDSFGRGTQIRILPY